MVSASRFTNHDQSQRELMEILELSLLPYVETQFLLSARESVLENASERDAVHSAARKLISLIVGDNYGGCRQTRIPSII